MRPFCLLPAGYHALCLNRANQTPLSMLPADACANQPKPAKSKQRHQTHTRGARRSVALRAGAGQPARTERKAPPTSPKEVAAAAPAVRPRQSQGNDQRDHPQTRPPTQVSQTVLLDTNVITIRCRSTAERARHPPADDHAGRTGWAQQEVARNAPGQPNSTHWPPMPPAPPTGLMAGID